MNKTNHLFWNIMQRKFLGKSLGKRLYKTCKYLLFLQNSAGVNICIEIKFCKVTIILKICVHSSSWVPLQYYCHLKIMPCVHSFLYECFCYHYHYIDRIHVPWPYKLVHRVNILKPYKSVHRVNIIYLVISWKTLNKSCSLRYTSFNEQILKKAFTSHFMTRFVVHWLINIGVFSYGKNGSQNLLKSFLIISFCHVGIR